MTRVIVVGGGIVGSMHALFARDAGHDVVHLEREAAPRGASVRNFGLVWVSGRAAGEELALALRSRELWESIAARIPAIGFRAHGSLTVARDDTELKVISQALDLPDAERRGWRLLDEAETRELNPALRGSIRGALWSQRDAIVEPRQATAAIIDHLAAGPRYVFVPRCEVTAISSHEVLDASGRSWGGDLVVVCTGAWHAGLAAALLGESALRRVRLQMLQTEPLDEPLTTSVADADSLRYYPAYASLDLDTLDPQSPVAADAEAQLLMVQRLDGSLTIGDTHCAVEPFPFDVDEAPYDHLKARAEELLGRRLPPVRRRWAGVYSQVTDDRIYHRSEPSPGVVVVTGAGGRGMTCAPAIAEETFR
jgi:FAD dependent oxidoreductase TIGR03364